MTEPTPASTPAPPPRDVAREVPLAGLQLLEASAGTGKTFALVGLVLRAVLERGLALGEVLVVTFTEAATAELRRRLRERLALARDLLPGGPLAAPAPEDDGAVQATRALVDAARAALGEAEARRRIEAARLALDQAPVFTLHGFCARALAEHALAAGRAGEAPAMVPDARALLREVAAALWRAHNAEPARMRLLLDLWRSPEALAADLPALLGAPLEPADPGPLDAPAPRADAALAEAWRAHADEAFALLHQAAQAGRLNGQRFTPDKLAGHAGKMRAWLVRGDGPPPLGQLPWYAQDALDEKGTKAPKGAKAKAEAPRHALFAAVQAWVEASAEEHAALARARLGLLHALARAAAARLAALKRARGQHDYDDLIAGVHDALEAEADGGGPRPLAAALRAQYALALVDEFQDTDPRQWAILRRLFLEPAAGGDADARGPRALVLVGDPKQAIYRFRGGDVHTYLAARDAALAAGGDGAVHALDANFRSRPAALRAVAAVFGLGGADRAFACEGIAFTPVRPGGARRDDAVLQGGAPAPGLWLHRLPPAPSGRALGVDAARAEAARACAAAVRDLLEGASVSPAPRPGQVAVLVESHRDAARIRRALEAQGLPCVSAGRTSLFATPEAADLLRVLRALLDPADAPRLRAALATPLLGEDAAALAALEGDDDALRGWLERMQAWRERWERHGVLALVEALAARAAPRLLAQTDGERVLGNHLQLGEWLQEAGAGMGAGALGAAGLADLLGRRIHDADEADEAQQLRLESDAERIQVLTLHRSKGLEYDWVFLPFLACGGHAGGRRGLAAVPARRDGRRVLALAEANPAFEAAAAEEAADALAERLRLAYVGLTRARLGAWLALGPVDRIERTALGWLLLRGTGPEAADAPDPARLDGAIAALLAQAGGAIAEAPPPRAPAGRWHAPPAPAVPPARVAARVLSRDWWVYSFTALAHEAAGRGDAGGATAADEAARAGDEPVAATAALARAGAGADADAGGERPPAGGAANGVDARAAVDPLQRFAGARFGNALHDALEHAEMAHWRGPAEALADDGPAWTPGHPLALAPEAQARLAQALRKEGYAAAADLAQGVPLLARLVHATLHARMPEGARLIALPEADKRHEMEFHLHLQPLRTDALLALLQAHGLVRGRAAFGARQRIEGLMTGRIDLLYRHQGRYFVLDYKSNRLPDYGPAALDAAVRHSEYDLQYALYTLALHRTLRFRLGGAYDYDRHVGGVRYLFCRGLAPDGDAPDAPDAPWRGVHADRLPRALVEGLDALFGVAPEDEA
jgi:exodeoxyribonuclease V beta subunit